MKPSISKKTQEYLKSLKNEVDRPQFHYDENDPTDLLIFEEGLRIKNLYIDSDLDLLVIILNNGKIIRRTITEFRLLNQAKAEQLSDYENDGFGIHWPQLDEDLSLRGFLLTELSSFKEKV